MKTALTALALIASATVSMAQEAAPAGSVAEETETDAAFTVVDTDALGNGQYEIGTEMNGEYTYWRANCVPMQIVEMDRASNRQDLHRDTSATMEDVFRGTIEHDIAAAGCN